MMKNTELDYISPHTRKSILTSTNPTTHKQKWFLDSTNAFTRR